MNGAARGNKHGGSGMHGVAGSGDLAGEGGGGGGGGVV